MSIFKNELIGKTIKLATVHIQKLALKRLVDKYNPSTTTITTRMYPTFLSRDVRLVPKLGSVSHEPRSVLQ